MIKGINKQIIEIRCTNNEYFDRALLFVSSDRDGEPRGVLERQARLVCDELFHIKQKRPHIKAAVIAAVILAAGAFLLLR